MTADRIVLKGRGVTGGVAEGEALVSRQAFGFTHGVEPTTGQIEDRRHEWLGQNMKGKVLVFPSGKSSSTSGLYILEVVRCGNGPAAVININTDPVIASGFIMADLFYNKPIPVVDRLDQDPVQVIKTGDRVRVDAKKGIVEIIKAPS